MIYIMSDLHGEYDLFVALMRKIGFTNKDSLYICGDVIEKSDQSVRLLRNLIGKPNVHLIRGNHEEAFIGYYHSLMAECDDYKTVLARLREYIQGDGRLLNWETVDAVESLPYYIETESFVCVHAGVPLDEEGRVPPLDSIRREELLYNRRFKDGDVLPRESKCVFYGHTTSMSVNPSGGILTYIREGGDPRNFADYIKVHLDTGCFVSGVMGCFCIDDCSCHYVSRGELYGDV